jgi:predicted RNA-binding Zn-ribbon protein involved in translation (DUF1610 family)
MMLKCDNCGYEDDESEYDTEKYWDNEGNHIICYVCPKCGKVIYSKEE